MKNSGQLLMCSTPDLTSLLNKSVEVIEGRMTVLLDNNPVKSFSLMIYPDPELDYLDIDTQLKDIEMKDTLLELKNELKSLRCTSSTLFIKRSISICRSELEDEFGVYAVFSYRNSSEPNTCPTCCDLFGDVWYFDFMSYTCRAQKAPRSVSKKATDEFSVVYFNSPETRGLMDPPSDTGNASAEQRTPRYVKQKGQVGEELIVKGATGNSQPKFDAIGIVDMLKEQNIFIERDLGYLRSMDEKDEQLVAVKTVLKTEVQDINAIIDEAMIMKDFNHPNVMSLIGISIAPGEFPLVIIPFMSNGDLLSYIRSANNKPTIKDLVQFGLDVARGMEYLGSIICTQRFSSQKLHTIHLSNRMDENLKVKVADFGLARDIYTKNYYSSDNKKMLPVKWMAPESLENGTYSTKSDVWSFGVVMWELITRGAAPYCDVNNWDMHKYLFSGRRLKRTEFCPTRL
ncbi:HGFR [Mytilus edulis]|uniref:MET n=1 Tax=Mytilus edulis TaxID=6550 RepID=A0A8S3SAC6_MYTED|nr:HGFR [Mytilus edulis]